MTTLFTYGTLKLGFQNHHRIFDGYDIKITPGFTLGKLYDLGLYPAMLKRIGNPDLSGTEGKEKVFGELIEFDNLEILNRVDYLEGFRCVNHPHNYYERREVDVFVGDDTVKAWVYVLSDEQIKQYDGKIIVSGKWIDWRQVEFPAD